MRFEDDKPRNWRKYVDKRRSFFETEIGGREVKVRVHFRPSKEGNIMWYLAARRSPAEEKKEKDWTTPWLTLEDWKQLGFLCLALSKFCVEPRFMDETSFEEIQGFKRNWDSLVKRNFRALNSRRPLMKELEEVLF